MTGAITVDFDRVDRVDRSDLALGGDFIVAFPAATGGDDSSLDFVPLRVRGLGDMAVITQTSSTTGSKAASASASASVSASVSASASAAAVIASSSTEASGAGDDLKA